MNPAIFTGVAACITAVAGLITAIKAHSTATDTSTKLAAHLNEGKETT